MGGLINEIVRRVTHLGIRGLTNSAWKAAIIADAMTRVKDGGFVVYADPSTRFIGNISHLLSAVQNKGAGVFGRPTLGPIANYTHPDTFEQLSMITANSSHIQVRRDIQEYMSAPMQCGCSAIWHVTPEVVDAVFRPYIRCLTSQACVRPHGANGFNGAHEHRCRTGLTGQCHRGDQSVLSTLLYERFRALSPMQFRRTDGTKVELQFPTPGALSSTINTLDPRWPHKHHQWPNFPQTWDDVPSGWNNGRTNDTYYTLPTVRSHSTSDIPGGFIKPLLKKTAACAGG